jgi:hypothetical protein
VESQFRITVITVVKDDLTGFVRTLTSVNRAWEHLEMHLRSQVEWVVIDSSNQPSLIPTAIDQSLLTTDYSWVPPNGVFSAMNSALEIAQGRYVWFLNSGDELADTQSLSVVLTALVADPVWALGEVVFCGADGSSHTSDFDFESERRYFFSRGKFPAHQGTVAERSVLESLGGFDCNYEIVADYKLALKLANVSSPLIISRPIARFEAGGISSTEWRKSLTEFHQARVEVYGFRGVALVSEFIRWKILYLRMWLARKVGRVPKVSMEEGSTRG